MSDTAAALVVIGAGGHAAEVCAYVQAVVAAGERVTLLGCVDERRPAGHYGLLTVLGGFDVLEQFVSAAARPLRCITAVGDNALRQRLVARVEEIGSGRIVWWTLRHPAAIVGPDVHIGHGTCLAPGSIITTRARLGAHVIMNVGASVSHDADVGDYVNLNPGSILAGNTRVAEGCFVGAGSTVIDRVSIGAWTTVGAGAAVVRDLPDHVTAVGVPARVIKTHAPAT